jgi:hypothetical protein
MQIENSGAIYKREFDKIDSDLSYSASLGMAMKLILSDPAFAGDLERFSLKFIRVARFLKANAPHVFQIREMGTENRNSMDRWLWDMLEQEFATAMGDDKHQGAAQMVKPVERADSFAQIVREHELHPPVPLAVQ